MTEADATTPIAGKRFIRNALLSLTGGALLTLAATGAAGAQTVGDQSGEIGNTGTAAASSGGNEGGGNTSGSEATADQDAGTTGGSAAANNSGGSSDIQTGDANSVGNQAQNQTTQITVTGSNGVVQIIDQRVVTTNTGSATSNTGGNVGTGNGSSNNANVDQAGTGGLAVNNGTAANNSTGTSNIGTGNASAVGNSANNIVHQTANGNAVGTLGGVLIIRQDGTVSNAGVATANTGNNNATGNSSGNTSTVGQTTDGGPDGLATNTGTASNNSGGTGNINTGNAWAVGNQSNTEVIQTANGTAGGALGGVILIDQNAQVANAGEAIANTGQNNANGNTSNNNATLDQDATADGPPADAAIASNDGITSNNSNGSANIVTGAAGAIGNDSTTNVQQHANATLIGGGVVLGNQAAVITNAGTATANTGDNDATANSSDNDAVTNQDATATGAGGPAVAANFGASTNDSNGFAAITTGAATAIGSRSNDTVGQSFNITGGDVSIVGQTAAVTNAGAAGANSGFNDANGNTSDNFALSDQTATADGAVGIAAPEQFGESHNTSNGTAWVTTGAATATGVDASTHVNQGVNHDGGADGGILLTSQAAIVTNAGLAEANSGLNFSGGNGSDNTALRFQDAEVDDTLDGDPAVVANFGAATNNSNGFGAVTTGAATATGVDSAATTVINQGVHGTGADLVIAGQLATTTNSGLATANSGNNFAGGNGSDNTAVVDQDADAGDGGTAGSVVATNDSLAGNTSNGYGAVVTGAATATGVAATNHTTQEVDVASSGDGMVIATQGANTLNSGSGFANSGDNTAVGNVSDNEAIVDQDANGAKDGDIDADGDVVVTNDADVSNTSDGWAGVSTGAATGTGVAATNTTNQTVTSAISGDGFVLADQYAYTYNDGYGGANSGDNGAYGNVSDNVADVDQDAAAAKDGDVSADGNVVVTNHADVANSSTGTAGVQTGNATATGVDADETNTTTQAINSGIAGDGFVIGTQAAYTGNAGGAYANSGDNLAVGNASDNEANLEQDADGAKDGGVDAGGNVVVTNDADVSTWSGGTAGVATGAATATGVAATNHTAQEINGGISGDGFVLGSQYAETYNLGEAEANSGNNRAYGNASDNEADVEQDANGAKDGDVDAEGDVVVTNNGDLNLSSTGTANIQTGRATATGVDADETNTTTQLINGGIAGDGFVNATQVALTSNLAYTDERAQIYGGAYANSGNNLAVGNASDNDEIDVDQDADGAKDGNVTAGGDVVVTNDADVSIGSDGTAGISTGRAEATGVAATNDTTQVVNGGIDGDGFVLSAQYSNTLNIGYGAANSGDNEAIGNDSDNDEIEIDQEASAAGKDNDVDAGGDVVVTNFGDVAVNSNGTANVASGDARAIGVDADETNTTTQVVNGGVGGDGFVLADQVSFTNNFGYGYANSGYNDATGNDSDNDVDLDQDATGADGGDVDAGGNVVVTNDLDANITSNGIAAITTGDACAYGVESTNDTTQAVNVGIDGDGFVNSAQYSDTYNFGVAASSSGFNDAEGNDSDNDEIDLDQEAYGADGGDVDAGGDVVVTNNGKANIVSNGFGAITTGEAAAWGVKASNSTDQSVPSSIGGDGLVLAGQASFTTNIGSAYAVSGDNFADGNESDNDDVEVDQEAAGAVGGDLTAGDDVVVTNDADVTSDSNGTAWITTGTAVATGVNARSATSQSVGGGIGGDGVVLADQYSDTYNYGTGYASSGDNDAEGNDSDNDIEVFQDAIGADGTLTADDVVATNFADATNTSNGFAAITTGTAHAQGVVSDTATDQSVATAIGGDGVLITAQVAEVGNYGYAYAYTGDNEATGNDSDNDMEIDQDANAGAGPFSSAVITNDGDGANNSNGIGAIVTGDAGALGVRARNVGSQSLTIGGDDTGVMIAGQESTFTNVGDATADTGDNDATGNGSDNEVEVDQTADGDPVDPATPIILTNFADASNNSNGTATVDTGNAAAGGTAVVNVGVQQIVGTFNGGVQLPTQIMAIANTGNASAETGDNDADGNDSNNSATVTQTGAGSTVVNNGSANNTSDGTSNIATGDAVACGNDAVNIGVQSYGAPAPAVTAPQPVSCVPDPPVCGCDIEDEPEVGKPEEPGKPGGGPGNKAHEGGPGGALARTGSDISEEALLGLFLLMAGGASKRKAKKLARKAQ